MTIREYLVQEPSNEAELGAHLREQALASGVLRLIVLEQLNELDSRRTRQNPKQQIEMTYTALYPRGESGLPFFIGSTTRTMPETGEIINGNGRLEVVGDESQSQEERQLRLYIYENDE